MLRRNKCTFLGVIASLTLAAQVPNPTTQPQPAPEQLNPAPIFRVEVVARSTQAVNYLHRGGATDIDFQGTALDASGKGHAKVESERGVIHVSADFKNLMPPSSYGPEYLTYVLWAISPDGRPVNLGELTLNDWGNGASSKIQATSDIQTFGMIVTAEPYYAVTQPSDVVVMENLVRPDTRGVIESINAKYELMPRGWYSSQGHAPGFVPIQVGKKDPFELYEAENAVQLARVAGADRYASDSFRKAQDALDQAIKYQVQHPGQKPVVTMAREACVRAEDSRVIAIRAERVEADNNERSAALARENAAKADADASRAEADREARQRALAEADRATAEQARASAEQAKNDALAAAQMAQRERAAAEIAKQQADAARQDAVAQQQQLALETDKARAAAADADARRLQAEQDQAQLRRQLLLQFNTILQTRDTARGLIVNMSDVLFDTAKYSLKPGAREKLAKVAGIILGHPGLRIAVEGHTDSVGGDDYNMKLSDNRANAVRDYLVAQGLNGGSITAEGFGKTRPVADNSTSAGRQQNRRVELVVSGEILGAPLTGRTSGDLR
jgi:outer membrane protein OmpA-like peptidoglycan-associated protein